MSKNTKARKRAKRRAYVQAKIKNFDSAVKQYPSLRSIRKQVLG